MVGKKRRGRYGESNAGGIKEKKYQVKIESYKARHEKRGVGKTKDAKALTPINNILRHKYLQYKRSRSRMTWPP